MNLDSLTIDNFLGVAPFATIIVLILLVGVGIAGYFTDQHVKTLKEFINHLKNITGK